MIQGRSSAGLQQKTVERSGIARELGRQEFQRNFSPQVEVLRLVNNSHPAAAKLAGNAVMRDGLSNHLLRARSISS
jgi:hypothetical protein